MNANNTTYINAADIDNILWELALTSEVVSYLEELYKWHYILANDSSILVVGWR
ncbi:hypothetical protein PIPA1_12640 [Pelosinus sp. IPA-1]|nr:hypothetical protein PIPA1_12640 [Pelosinus sp. IPA-1]